MATKPKNKERAVDGVDESDFYPVFLNKDLHTFKAHDCTTHLIGQERLCDVLQKLAIRRLIDLYAPATAGASNSPALPLPLLVMPIAEILSALAEAAL